ncbi:hypothetical protein H8D85_00190 [bacterium]|nr:hypothetical protein [bacterium]
MNYVNLFEDLIGTGAQIYTGIQARDRKKAEETKLFKAEQKLKNLEKSRQAVMDQSGAIRALKSQVFNPAANLAVANKAAELKIEQTDQALANTLDQINRSGTGAGAATALARMAAASKAEVGASLEKSEMENQKLRAAGEAKAAATKLRLEEAALREEGSAWTRQETRDLTQLDRLQAQQENAQTQALAFEEQQDAAMLAGLKGLTGTLGDALNAKQGGELDYFEDDGWDWADPANFDAKMARQKYDTMPDKYK